MEKSCYNHLARYWLAYFDTLKQDHIGPQSGLVVWHGLVEAK